jgi:Tfp pilus assembly protein PilF
MRFGVHYSVFALGLTLFVMVNGCGKSAPDAGPSPKAVEAVNRGVSAMGQYDYDGAVKAFEEAVQAAPDLPAAKVNLAIARFNRGRKEFHDIEVSRELLDNVLQRDTNHVRALYFKGIVLQHVGESEGAIACFERTVQLRPEDGVAWYLLGMCRQRLGQKCERELLKAIELRPYLGSAYYKLFQALQAEGRTEEGKVYLDTFKQLRDNPLNETIELPQYNQMGGLALVLPLEGPGIQAAASRSYTVKPSAPAFEVAGALAAGIRGGTATQSDPRTLNRLAGAVLSRVKAGEPTDLILVAQNSNGEGQLRWFRAQPDGRVTEGSSLGGQAELNRARACAMGDIDNDGTLDLVVASSDKNRLLLGKGSTFQDATDQAGSEGLGTSARSVLLVDADHDGDLDVLLCGLGDSGLQLWNNNADGTFTNIAPRSGIACPKTSCAMVLPGDVDGDRDTDLLVLCQAQPGKLFVNDLLNGYREANLGGAQLRGELGGVLQDFNGDGCLDALVLGGSPARLQLITGNGKGSFQAGAVVPELSEAGGSQAAPRAFRVADLDLDGDLDVVWFSDRVVALLNDGTGRFMPQPPLWKADPGRELLGAEIADLDADGVSDLVTFQKGARDQIQVLRGQLSPPSTALAIFPTGIRERDKRTRSPATGYGAVLTVQAGLKQQSRVFTGQSGGVNQSPLPLTFGLGGAARADYVHVRWPDGVAQVETALAAGKQHLVAELQRKISSCPVLFAWNGRRFEFITDFAGIGGLGYFVAPGEYAQPQVLEHVKIEPSQLSSRDGVYEMRVTEPMEETAYVDRLELLAIDHPRDWQVFPDERLAVTGPQPSHALLVVKEPIYPRKALDPQGRDCTSELLKVDRVYAYHPELDRRFFGFCRRHTLELDFGDRLAGIPRDQRLFLFLNGFLEYPYSQTAYAASQARIGWEPIRIEQQLPNGEWQVIIPDAGAFGGMARTMTVELTGLLTGPQCRLRFTSNLEIFYDQVFVARDEGRETVQVRSLPLVKAELRQIGFPREVSPDGRLPLLYDYEQREATAPFLVLKGAYTSYGPVRELLTSFDDQFALVGPGDEIALEFGAGGNPNLPRGMTRSFILVSHAYCKDMDLYTAAPDTLEPMPFRQMSRYPYPSGERYPDTAETRRYRERYNTRWVK